MFDAAASKTRWAKRMTSSHAYHCAAKRSVRAVSEVVTVRQVRQMVRMAQHKHKQGSRRAVRRMTRANWLIPRHMHACAALRIGKARNNIQTIQSACSSDTTTTHDMT